MVGVEVLGDPRNSGFVDFFCLWISVKAIFLHCCGLLLGCGNGGKPFADSTVDHLPTLLSDGVKK